MRIKLDQEQWESGPEATLESVFAEVSDRAHARARIVTMMRLDQREITDRDIDATLMAEAASRYETLTAVSQAVRDVEHDARIAAGRYAKLLHAEAFALLGMLRAGAPEDRAMNEWLGKLADYLEFTEGRGMSSLPGNADAPLSSWIQDLLTARERRDTVLTADLLEYEILPRLQG